MTAVMLIDQVILKLRPPVKDYIWGGTRLREEFGKEPVGERLAESWELSCNADGLSVIDGGEYDGVYLSEYIAEHPEAMGENCRKYSDFPILIKLIDAKEDLSVQVHPDDDYALKNEGKHGKNEMWYVLDCEADSHIIYGFRESITKEEFRRAVRDNTLMEKLNYVPVKKGDVFMINAGTVHSIGKGCLMAEIQQNSNVTYRVYDYERRDSDGNLRELHIEKALDVMERVPSQIMTQQHGKILIESEYFSVYKENFDGNSDIRRNDKSFTHILITDGFGIIESGCGSGGMRLNAEKGGSFFVPAGVNWRVKGKCSIIYTVV